MAVAYWTYERFFKCLKKQHQYFICYKDQVYFVNKSIININTFERKDSNIISLSDEKLKIGDQMLKDIWDEVEIIEEVFRYTIYTYKTLVDIYTGKAKNELWVSKIDIDKYKRTNKAVQYISFPTFVNDILVRGKRTAPFKIIYNGEEYYFDYKNFKYSFGKIGCDKNKQYFKNANNILESANIDGVKLQDIWDECECILPEKVISADRDGEKKSISIKERREIDSVIYSAQKKLVKEGKIPIIRFGDMLYGILYSIAIDFMWINAQICIATFLLFLSGLLRYGTNMLFSYLGFVVPFNLCVVVALADLEVYAGMFDNLRKYYKVLVPFVLIVTILYGKFFLVMLLATLSTLIGHLLIRVYYNKKIREADKIRNE